MKTVRVPLGQRSYKILIGSGLTRNLSSILGRHLSSNKIVILTNSKIGKLYRSKINKLLEKKFLITWITIPDGERFKNIRTVEKIYHQLATSKIDRQSSLIALGGGVIGDIAGFVASTYLRGIPYIQIPTTLLSQVDSSVGGKTGFDLASGKNLVGTFYQPKLVLIDIDFLKTLSKREYLCGLSEVVKYGVLWDATFFKFLESNKKKILSLNPQTLIKIIHRSCEIKARIVQLDEKESGLRSRLNFGHTLGHAIETLSGYNKIRHGEGVSMGMAYAAKLSFKKKLCSKETIERIIELLNGLGLPTQWPKLSKSRLRKVISLDKKALEGEIRYVIVTKIGSTKTILLTPLQITKYL